MSIVRRKMKINNILLQSYSQNCEFTYLLHRINNLLFIDCDHFERNGPNTLERIRTIYYSDMFLSIYCKLFFNQKRKQNHSSNIYYTSLIQNATIRI